MFPCPSSFILVVTFLHHFVLVLGFAGRFSSGVSHRPATLVPGKRIPSPGGGIDVEHSGIEMSGMFLHIVCLLLLLIGFWLRVSFDFGFKQAVTSRIMELVLTLDLTYMWRLSPLHMLRWRPRLAKS